MVCSANPGRPHQVILEVAFDDGAEAALRADRQWYLELPELGPA